MTPIDMILHCPKCGMQHIDAPDRLEQIIHRESGTVVDEQWTNPPHRSHLCHGCGCIWRPADVPTNGVLAITTRGKADTWPAAGVSALPTPKPCPGCAQYHGRNDCPVGWLAPAEPYGVPASEYLAKIKADPRRAAALQRARDRAAGVAERHPRCVQGGRCDLA